MMRLKWRRLIVAILPLLGVAIAFAWFSTCDRAASEPSTPPPSSSSSSSSRENLVSEQIERLVPQR
jgi:hypothetical protein